MVFSLSKVFVALVAVTAVSASAIKRQTDLASCDFVMTPDATVEVNDDLTTEFNFVLGRSLSIDAGDATIDGTGSTFVANDDGTFTVHDNLGVVGKSAQDTASILEGWPGETKEGIQANWLIDSVSCEASA
ncbi:hypothetical protein D9758_018278 [Tetrapyrgos nigripes]|uniref:Uncharacterized protein n=1 Tax=Tetrapyrgos nigripes TaxID=182062 RepID=A0A8H5C0X7_9AGAR|nr:hypothetical protein D9758_018278 [Tetrapyrgos nigripes]